MTTEEKPTPRRLIHDEVGHERFFHELAGVDVVSDVLAAHQEGLDAWAWSPSVLGPDL